MKVLCSKVFNIQRDYRLAMSFTIENLATNLVSFGRQIGKQLRTGSFFTFPVV